MAYQNRLAIRWLGMAVVHERIDHAECNKAGIQSWDQRVS